jgi:hypothetical protein
MEIRALDEEEAEAFREQRDWLNELLAGVGSDVRLTARVEDLPNLQSILDNGPYTDEPMGELGALGTAFGDVLGPMLDMEWVVFTDEDGSSFALRHATKSVLLFPHDSILKRLEEGQQLHFDQLFRDLSAEVRRQLELPLDRHREP